MTHEQVLDWLAINLAEWPKRTDGCGDLPNGNWSWWHLAGEMVVLNSENGDFIGRSEFENFRYEQRLTPCGMSFKMMIEDLKL